MSKTHWITHYRQCQRKLTSLHGYDRPIWLQHLPIFERKVYIELKPKRYRCRHCEGAPTTTQQLDWYTPNSPHTKALDHWLLKMLVNPTVLDVSRCCQVGYDVVEGCIDRYVDQSVDWERLTPFTTRQRLNVNGVFSMKQQRPLIRLEETVNAQATLRLFDEMQKAQPRGTLHVIADNARYYRCQAVSE